MHPKEFYLTEAVKAIPLILVTKKEWDEGFELSEKERNSFSFQQFSGKLGEVCLITNNEGEVCKAYVGASEGSDVLAMANAAIRLPKGIYAVQQNLSHTAQVNWSLAQYRFGEYKKQDWTPRVLVVKEERLAPILAEANAVFLVRDLINKPTNDLGPEDLAVVLSNLAKEFNAKFHQWVGNELISANFTAIHAVGRASAKSPRLLSLTWGSPENPHLCLVGKGVCFDSGGLDLKPADGMRWMKKDMGGAAHAMGLAQWIMSQNLPLYLQVFIPAVENSVGPDSFRPGDVLRMHNGLTVEVANTDAEGRLVLADAICKGCEEKPDLLIDFATLTGAARVALGTEIAAMFCNDDKLAESLKVSSEEVSDPIWRLPLHSAYAPLIDSTIADYSNLSSSPFGGAITAALFLQYFVPKSLPWVHFDIMAWNVSSKPGRPEGGEAMSLRAVMHYLNKTYGSKNAI